MMMPAAMRWSGSMMAPLPTVVAMTGATGVRTTAIPIASPSLISADDTVRSGFRSERGRNYVYMRREAFDLAVATSRSWAASACSRNLGPPKPVVYSVEPGRRGVTHTCSPRAQGSHYCVQYR